MSRVYSYWGGKNDGRRVRLDPQQKHLREPGHIWNLSPVMRPDGTFRLWEQPDMDAYDVIRVLLDTGDWRVDAEAGRVYGMRGRRIGYQHGHKTYKCRRAERCSDHKDASGARYRYLKVITPDGRYAEAFEHRVIWEAVHGFIPKDMEIDHLNGDQTDNRIANLDLVTKDENMRRRWSRWRHQKVVREMTARQEVARALSIHREVAAVMRLFR